ncbi:MAG: guanylate kinase [Acidobacteriota bacterium]
MVGNLIIISSPSGGGKGTLIKEVRQTVPDLGYSVSFTTREARSGEQNGREYFFVSADDFRARAEKGNFLEYATVHGHFYGTSKSHVEGIMNEGKDVILEIDVQGAALVTAKMPYATTIFILPPSYEVLRARLTSRATEGMKDLAVRLRNSFDEVREYSKFRYVVINDDLASASRRLASIIIGERQQVNRQTAEINSILHSFDISKL